MVDNYNICASLVLPEFSNGNYANVGIMWKWHIRTEATTNFCCCSFFLLVFFNNLTFGYFAISTESARNYYQNGNFRQFFFSCSLALVSANLSIKMDSGKHLIFLLYRKRFHVVLWPEWLLLAFYWCSSFPSLILWFSHYHWTLNFRIQTKFTLFDKSDYFFARLPPSRRCFITVWMATNAKLLWRE